MPKSATAKKPHKKPVKSAITFRRRRFALIYARNGGNGTQAAREAGFKGSDVALAVTASRALRSAQVRQLVEMMSVPLVDLADSVVADCLIGNHPPDIKLKAADLAYKRTGAYAPEKHEVTPGVPVLTEEQRSRFARIIELGHRPPLSSPPPPTGALEAGGEVHGAPPPSVSPDGEGSTEAHVDREEGQELPDGEAASPPAPPPDS